MYKRACASALTSQQNVSMRRRARSLSKTSGPGTRVSVSGVRTQFVGTTRTSMLIATHIRLPTNRTTYNFAAPDVLSTASMQHKESAMSRWPAITLFIVVAVWSELPAQVQDEGSLYYPPL